MISAIELRRKRAALVTENRAILDKSEKEARELTAEEQQEWDRRDNDVEAMSADIDRVEKQEKRDADIAGSDGPLAGGRQQADAEPNTDRATPTVDEAFRSWMVHGPAGLTPEMRSAMASRQADLTPEMRAQSVGLDTGGGYLVPDGFVANIETALADYSGVRKTRATILRTASGADIHMPMVNDTSNSGELLGENVAATEEDITVGAKTLRSYMFSSKMVKVSLQFLRDVGVSGIEAFLAAQLGERIGRALGAYYLTGTGANQPEGLATAATSGVTSAAATALTYDEIVDLEHSIDPAYRKNAEFLLADGALKVLKKLKDGEGRPMWVPGMATREPNSILGYPYAIDTNLATPAASTKSVFFGDFSKFILRDVGGPQMLRLTERYAEYLQVAFLLFSAHDSALLDAGTYPIKYITQHA